MCIIPYYLFFSLSFFFFFFFFNDTATTEIYTLSLHDALPISPPFGSCGSGWIRAAPMAGRSEEHTSELQSHVKLVCRLLLEKKKKQIHTSCVGKERKQQNENTSNYYQN